MGMKVLTLRLPFSDSILAGVLASYNLTSVEVSFPHLAFVGIGGTAFFSMMFGGVEWL